ncbi:LytR family transcriptional regulator [Crassaminicella thermophila]|uniref:LytR family transcriptional regulator n=1 Tax=Crassaminicella thermophila TaxID=2599308 RepID=A0A5C0SAL4_CRATE|nr:LCP family protein [Crassaminicella thermophila]QEK11070.1 LytR family transcriptional regulator [Crassaminicella thermophila]
MKTFLKIFAIAFACFIVAMGAGLWAFSKFYHPATDVIVSDKPKKEPIEIVDSNKEPVEEKSELEKLIDESKRINILLLGMEGPRTDTIVFASFDPESKNLDLVSIPRDTYYARKGYSAADEKKINAVYGDEGIEGTMRAVSKVLGGVPIDHYVKVTYSGVERIVNSLGGVQVNIPMNMDYDDPYANPPLHIHLKKGTQVLDGKHAIQFLRFRKGNNGGGYPDGDLGRIKAQQQFINAAIGKALSFRLPVVANTVMKYVKTDISIPDMAIMAKNAVGMTRDNLKAYSLPGRPINQNHLSYFLHDQDEVENLIKEIYSRGKE